MNNSKQKSGLERLDTNDQKSSKLASFFYICGENRNILAHSVRKIIIATQQQQCTKTDKQTTNDQNRTKSTIISHAHRRWLRLTDFNSRRNNSHSKKEMKSDVACNVFLFYHRQKREIRKEKGPRKTYIRYWVGEKFIVITVLMTAHIPYLCIMLQTIRVTTTNQTMHVVYEYGIINNYVREHNNSQN